MSRFKDQYQGKSAAYKIGYRDALRSVVDALQETAPGTRRLARFMRTGGGPMADRHSDQTEWIAIITERMAEMFHQAWVDLTIIDDNPAPRPCPETTETIR